MGVTLHRRSGSGDGDGWHLVLPGPDGTTDDVVVPPAPSRGGKVPAELSALVTALRRGAPLQPVAVRRTRHHGEPGGEVVDDAIEVREEGEQPEIPVPPRVRRSDPVGEAIRADLAKHTRRLLLADLGVRRDLPESVHDMRVAARHLRSTLKTFRAYVDEDWPGVCVMS